jgi:hypothetical protein
MGANRWVDDLLRLLVAAAFLMSAKMLLGKIGLWDALRSAGAMGMLLLGLILLGDVLTRWLGLRGQTGAGKSGTG